MFHTGLNFPWLRLLRNSYLGEPQLKIYLIWAKLSFRLYEKQSFSGKTRQEKDYACKKNNQWKHYLVKLQLYLITNNSVINLNNNSIINSAINLNNKVGKHVALTEDLPWMVSKGYDIYPMF